MRRHRLELEPEGQEPALRAWVGDTPSHGCPCLWHTERSQSRTEVLSGARERAAIRKRRQRELFPLLFRLLPELKCPIA